MEVLRRFLAIAIADLRERTRAVRFWVILGVVAVATWLCFPAAGSGWFSVAIDDTRGVYNSAWAGLTLALVYSTMLAWPGFYLVRGSVVRDFDTRVWQLLVATPMTRAGYLLAKWTSHMTVFAVVMAVGLAVGFAAQMLRGEDRSLDLYEMLKPVVVITMPSLALTAFFAILFDMVPWLRRAAGNVIYFFVWVAIFSTFAANMDPSTSEWARTTWFSDPSGTSLAQREFIETLPALVPGIDATSLSIGVSAASASTRTFVWSGISFDLADLAGRLLWLLVPALLTAALAPLLDLAARYTTAAAPSRPGMKLRWLDFLLRPIVRSGTGLVVASELKLVLRQRRLWWWAAMLVCAIVQLAAEPKGMAAACIVAWMFSIDVFGRSLLRERDTGSAELVLTGPGAARKLRIARLATALAVAIVPVLPALLRLAASDAATAATLGLVAANVALAGLGLAALCRSPRPYELTMVFCAYIGVQDAGPLAALSLPGTLLGAHLLLAPLSLAALVLLWPPRRDGDAGFVARRFERLRLAAATIVAR